MSADGWCQVNAALSPEEMIALGKAFDRLIEKRGPFTDLEKEAIAESLLSLYQEGIKDIDRPVELATPQNKRN